VHEKQQNNGFKSKIASLHPRPVGFAQSVAQKLWKSQRLQIERSEWVNPRPHCMNGNYWYCRGNVKGLNSIGGIYMDL
jgi:hypothetical protein